MPLAQFMRLRTNLTLLLLVTGFLCMEVKPRFFLKLSPSLSY
uniref:Uncharacterized protein n=1 Tax=Anguilla anguilla TaxID=7936 RepID=A0A0E9R9Z0_ANGAN